MSRTPGNFYVTGGTLGQDVPCYVPRQADHDLYDGLKHGEFCYVLTSRQMGKSSLMVRTAARLRAEGVGVVVLDLTGIGVNVTAEQWYDGLLARVGRQVGLEEELEHFWQAHVRLSPLQRWMRAIEEVVLPRRTGMVVVFVDEIDAVRSLPFSADEFFAAIRESYNRRSEDPALAKLTFCLLGVATPSDLIRDARMTPFNIGRRVELHDFRANEAELLAAGLGRDEHTAMRLLRRILDWTGGHPYLTQRLCDAVAGDKGVTDVRGVDGVCARAFLSQRAREQDDNLVFVRQRILRSGADIAGVLELYGRVLRGQPIHADETDPSVSPLRLSGLVRTVDDRLQVRNRIYRCVFDRDWIQANMPDAELRRQQAAFRRGLFRATAVASVVVLILAASMLLAFHQWRQAEQARRNESASLAQAIRAAEEATRQSRRAEQAAQEARQARDAERRQRERAEEQTALAQEAQQKAEAAAAVAARAQGQAEAAAREAGRARDAERTQRELAEARRKAEELARQEAEAAQEQTRLALARAEAEKRLAEQHADLARRRGELFEKLLPWLQEHAAEGVVRYARSLEQQGDPRGSLKAFVAFCDLVLGDRAGFLTHELLELDPLDLRTLDLDDQLVQVRISVPPITLSTVVLEPAIEVGERQLRADPDDETRKQVGRLYATQARLILEHLEEPWPFADPLPASVRGYDRAIGLDAEPFEYYAGRASARFRLPDRKLRDVLADLDQALTRFPDAPEPPRADLPITATHRQMAGLHYARGNVLELLADQDATDKAAGLYEEAAQAHARAGELNPKDARFPLAVARSLHRQAARWASAPPSREDLQRALQLLNAAAALDPDLAEIHNQQGEVYLALGRIAEARDQFSAAVEKGRRGRNKVNLYRYYCNAANAYTRGQPTGEDYRQALEAADQAVALQPDRNAEASYFRGLALWGSKRTSAALEALDQALAMNAEHVGALLARCQIVFETQHPAPTSAQLDRAVRDADVAVKLVHQTGTTSHDKAKAYYVHSLAWLRRHVDTKSEQSLVKCQEDLIRSAGFSPEYVPAAQKVFDYAASLAWKDSELRQASQRLQEQFASLTKR